MKGCIFIVENENFTFRKGFKDLLEVKFGKDYIVSTKDSLQDTLRGEPKLVILTQEVLKEVNAMEKIRTLYEYGTKFVLIKENDNGFPFELNMFNGFLSKRMSTKEMTEAIENVLLHGTIYVHPDIGAYILSKYNRFVDVLKTNEEVRL
ncbi:hypothetical protein ACTNDN_20840 [Niallia sp. HCP3S3_B10]|uniref:hypothetical protein n=1 Tax=Niallia sp. HCP3S3_B10 TaxID=3438944 RepID=UPI003F8B23D0